MPKTDTAGNVWFTCRCIDKVDGNYVHCDKHRPNEALRMASERAREQTQPLRKAIEKFYRDNPEEMLRMELLTAENRPWGYFKVLHKDEMMVVKKLVVNPGRRTSLQHHTGRDETWVVQAGEGLATVGRTVQELHPNVGPLWVTRGEVHSIENDGDGDLIITEVWHGPNLDEDDIVRHEDDYERA